MGCSQGGETLVRYTESIKGPSLNVILLIPNARKLIPRSAGSE